MKKVLMMAAVAMMTAISVQAQRIQTVDKDGLVLAKAGLELAEKSYKRVQQLFDEEVVSAQKRDEAEAMYKSAQAQVKAAQSQYDMAVNGARQEERRAASASHYSRRTHYKYLDDVEANTFEIRLGATVHL